MLSLHARKPAAAAHDTGGPVLVKLPASGGATARAGAEASLLGNRDAPGAAAGAAAPAGSSPEAQEAGSGAAAGAAASAAPSAAKAPRSHKDVPGASALPAVKQRVIDGCIDLAAQYTAHAAAAADLVRRDVFKVQAKYLSRFPPLVVSEYKRAKGGGHAADKSKKDLAFPRADLKAAVGLAVPDSIVGAVPGVKVGDLFPNRAMARLVGLLKPLIKGIETADINGRPVATAIADSGIYADNFADETFETMTYTGEGANDGLGNKQQKGDQSADVRCNRALAAAVELAPSGHCIRVLVKVQGGFMQSGTQFLFVGLYAAENFRREAGDGGYFVYRVTLRRAAGQEALSAEALELLRTAVRCARETAAKSKKRAQDAAVKKEEGGEAPPRPAKRARPAARAPAEGDDAAVDEVAELTAFDTPKLVLQVLVRGINAASEASGAACGESITTLLGQNKTRQANFVLALRDCWGALSVTQLIAAGKEAFAAGLAAGTGKVADDAATAALLPLLKAGPSSAGTPPAAAPQSKRGGAGRAPRGRRPAAASDSADDADGDAAAKRPTPRRAPRAAPRRRIIASSDDDDADDDAAAVDTGDAAPEAAALDALSPEAVKVLCEALEVDAGLASALPAAALVAQVREARAQQWPHLSERQLAALVRHSAGKAAEVNDWRDAIMAGIDHAAQAAAAPKPAAPAAKAGPRGRSARRRAGPAPWLLDASLLPSDDEEAPSDGDPDFSLRKDSPRRHGRRQASSAAEEEEDEDDEDDDDDDDIEDDDEEDEASLASESEEVAARRPQRHSARCAGGRFASRKRAKSPSLSASPPPPPARRAARAAKPRAEPQPRAAPQQPQPRAARPALEVPNAAAVAAAVEAAAEAAASAPAEPAAEAPKAENPAAAAAAAAPGASVEQLLELLLSLETEIPQAEPLTDDELCSLVMRFTARLPPPPSAHMTEAEVAAVAKAQADRAQLDADARFALQRIAMFRRSAIFAPKIATVVFRASFLS